MARPLRIQFPGALYHVMSRGDDRRPIVRDDRDRDRRLDWLARTVAAYGWRLYAFAILDNHDHLFLETPEPNLSAGMQFLNGSYTSYVNIRHQRAGHLFQGRYKAHVIENEGHYWEISRYIHLNPLRAGLVGRPEEWPWSSYRGYHAASRALSWVDYDRVLSEFGKEPAKARQAYRGFVGQGMATPPAAPWERAVEGIIIGAERFVDRIRGMLHERKADGSLPTLRKLRTRPPLDRIADEAVKAFGGDPSTWLPGRRVKDPARRVAAYIARRRFGYSTVEVAQGLGYATHGGAVTAVRKTESGDPALLHAANLLAESLAFT